jgi:hypothetical protein
MDTTSCCVIRVGLKLGYAARGETITCPADLAARA